MDTPRSETKPNSSRPEKTAGIGFGEEGETLGGGSGRSGGVAEGLGAEKLARTGSDHEEPQNDRNEKKREREWRDENERKLRLKRRRRRRRRSGRGREEKRTPGRSGGVEELSQRWIDPERSAAVQPDLQRTHTIDTHAAAGHIPRQPSSGLAIAGVLRHCKPKCCHGAMGGRPGVGSLQVRFATPHTTGLLLRTNNAYHPIEILHKNNCQ